MAKFTDRTGEKGVSNEGYSMEIVAYRGATDIDILVDGKYLRKNCHYGNFKKGSVSRDKGTRKDRTGETSKSFEGYSLEILAYRRYEDIDVLIDGQHIVKGVRYSHFKSGRMCNPYHRSVCGVGYFGIGKYKSREGGKVTEVYRVWSAMFARCYDERILSKHPNYKGCEVDERFHNFQDFGAWFEENYYVVEGERMHLDKDILIKGNRLYSPDTCVFVPQRINSLLTSSKRSRGKYPIGVSKMGKKYTSSYCNNGSVHLGMYDTPEEAFHAYKTAKEAYIKQVADEYKDKIPKKLYDALYAYIIEITD